MKKSWRTYEEVATFLLNELSVKFKLERVEGKQSMAGLASGTNWEIDAKGVKEGDSGFVLIEVRRYTSSRLSQEDMAAVAYRIQDTGAVGGIVVSPLPLQVGAQRVAEAANIVAVQLSENSTTTEYILRFLNNVMVSLAPDSVIVSVSLVGGTLSRVSESEQEG
ncbi:hypothetical protein D3C78_485410 [compost metagenome]